jgi:cytochrome c-type biogenesis protein CcmH
VKVVALVLAIVLVALVAAGPASAERPSLAKLESEIMCPVCKTTLDQSDSPAATRIKQLIAGWIREGRSEDQIKSMLVASYGESILASPPKKGFDLLVWVLPPVGIVAAAIVLGALALRWSRAREPAPASATALDPELERRLDEELARFEGQ